MPKLTVGRKEVEMAEFPVNPTRFDPYKDFKFRVKWDGQYVAGVSQPDQCFAADDGGR